jgi:hypothetical protein
MASDAENTAEKANETIRRLIYIATDPWGM